MAKLAVHHPDGSMREVILDRDRITIGRRADNDLCLPYPAVSAEHAEIVTIVGDSFLHDMGSTNGTLVNGARVTKHFLRDHDRIDIGRIQLVYLADEAETVEPLPPQPSDQFSQASELPPDVQRVVEAQKQSETVATSASSSSAKAAPVDDLLEDLMETDNETSVAVDMAPTLSIARASTARNSGASQAETLSEATGGVYLEVMNGPNAGQITPMTKREFVLGKSGATMAVIRRVESGYRVVPVDKRVTTLLNGQPIDQDGALLSFGDLIEVGGVKLRFGRRG